MGHRQIWDLHHRQYRMTGIVAVPVRQPNVEGELWLVVSRPGKGRTPWPLLTNESIGTAVDAWRVMLARPPLAGGDLLPSLQDRPGHG